MKGHILIVTLVLVISSINFLSISGTGIESKETRISGHLIIENILLDGDLVDGCYSNNTHYISVKINNTTDTIFSGKTLNCTIGNSSNIEDLYSNVPINTIYNKSLIIQVVAIWTPESEKNYWINISLNQCNETVFLNKSFKIQTIIDLYPKILSPTQDMNIKCKSSLNKNITCIAMVSFHGNIIFNSSFYTQLIVYNISNIDNILPSYSVFYRCEPVNISNGNNITFNLPAWKNISYIPVKFELRTNYSLDDIPSNDIYHVNLSISYTYWDEVRRGNISGALVDERNGNVGDATIRLFNSDFNITIHVDYGYFFIEGIPSNGNPYTINITQFTCFPKEISGINVTENKTLNLEKITLIRIKPCKLWGYIQDSNGDPVMRPILKLEPLATIFGDEYGYYELNGILTGNYYLTCREWTYYPINISITFNIPGENRSLNITLTPLVDWVITTTPMDGGRCVSPSQDIIISFNRPFNPTTVNKSSVCLKNSQNNSVDCNLSILEENTKIILQPLVNLTIGNRYFLQIDHIIDDIKMWSYTKTISFNVSIKPRVLSIYPPNQACWVSISLKELYVYFNIKLKEPIADNCITLRSRGGDTFYYTPGTIHYDDNNKRLIYELKEKLKENSAYQVTIENLMSIDNEIIDSYSWDFATEKIFKGSLCGNITDVAGTSLSGAQIKIINITSTTTNSKGYFFITNLLPGMYVLNISYGGYRTISLLVTIVANITVDISLFNNGMPVELTKNDTLEDNRENKNKDIIYVSLVVFLIIVIILTLIIVVVLRYKAVKKSNILSLESEGSINKGQCSNEQNPLMASEEVISDMPDKKERENADSSEEVIDISNVSSTRINEHKAEELSKGLVPYQKRLLRVVKNSKEQNNDSQISQKEINEDQSAILGEPISKQ